MRYIILLLCRRRARSLRRCGCVLSPPIAGKRLALKCVVCLFVCLFFCLCSTFLFCFCFIKKLSFNSTSFFFIDSVVRLSTFAIKSNFAMARRRRVRLIRFVALFARLCAFCKFWPNLCLVCRKRAILLFVIVRAAAATWQVNHRCFVLTNFDSNVNCHLVFCIVFFSSSQEMKCNGGDKVCFVFYIHIFTSNELFTVFIRHARHISSYTQCPATQYKTSEVCRKAQSFNVSPCLQTLMCRE